MSKLVPVTVAGTPLAPWWNTDGTNDVIVGTGGLGPMVRQAVQVSATSGEPGSITVMSRAVCEALLRTVSFTLSCVGETTVTLVAKTPSPSTMTLGVPEKPLPVSVTVSVVESPMTAGDAPSKLVAVMGEPGVVTS